MKVIIIIHTIMIYGYIRVSSDKQTVENQRFEISNFCEHQNLSIDDWIEETISGTKNYSKRQLGNLLKKINKDDIIILLSGKSFTGQKNKAETLLQDSSLFCYFACCKKQ